MAASATFALKASVWFLSPVSRRQRATCEDQGNRVTVIVTVATACRPISAPPSAVTSSLAVYVPGAAYEWLTQGWLRMVSTEASELPSPKSTLYHPEGAPVGNWIASGAVPVTRDAVRSDEFAAAAMQPTSKRDDIATAASFTRIAII